MNTPTEMIYLQKTPREMDVEDAIKNFNVYFESIDEYIERIKNQKKSVLVKNDIEYHIRQLLDIMVDTELVYEWLKIKYAPDSVKANFLLGINSKEQLDNLVSYTKRNFSNDKKLDELISRNYQEALDELYTQIKEMQSVFDRQSERDNELKIRYTQQALSGLLNVGISFTLGLRLLPKHLAERYLYFALSNQYRTCYFYDYIAAPILQFNKKNHRVIKFKDNAIFYSNIARNAYNGIVLIWDALNPYEDVTKDIPNNTPINKGTDYSNCTRDELIKELYKQYPLLPKNFLNILQTHKYKDVMIAKVKNNDEDYLLRMNDDNKSFTIKNGYFSLVVTYIWSKVDIKKGSGSWSLILTLFNKQLKNPSSTSKLYEEGYLENHLKPFEEFLNKCKED